jgi:hypothetical protein
MDTGDWLSTCRAGCKINSNDVHGHLSFVRQGPLGEPSPAKTRQASLVRMIYEEERCRGFVASQPQSPLRPNGDSLVAMCGRQRYTWREIHDLYGLTGAARNLQAHYNIAPTDTVDVVRPANGGATELVPMRWGLIPYWWEKPLKQLPATFNARAESVADKPMFRDAFKAPSLHHPGERLL